MDRKAVKYTQVALVITIFAFLARIITAALYTNDYDTQWNLMWAADLQSGLFNAYDGHVRQLDYPPLYLFVLKLVGMVTENPAVYNFAPLRMLAIKLVPVLCDSAICFLLFRLGSRRSLTMGLIGCALWAINPASFFNCAFWGQTDCVMLFALLVVFLLLTDNRPTAAAVCYALCILLKFQCIYFAPVVLLELVRLSGGVRSAKAWLSAAKQVAIAVAVWVAVWIPFIIGAKNILLPFEVYLGGADTYPYINLNADNIFGIFNLNWEPETAFTKVWSAVCILLVFAAVTASYFRYPRVQAAFAALLAADGIFMLTARQHERYQITALIFIIFAYLIVADSRLLLIFCAQSALVLFNQLRVLGLVNHGGDWANALDTLQTINSLLNAAVFIWTLFVLVDMTEKAHKRQVTELGE